MSAIRDSFAAMQAAFGDNRYFAFMLAHGRKYEVGPMSFAGPRGEPKACFSNAGTLALENPDLTYVEGQILVCGVPIDHAWCIDKEGIVVDPTVCDPDHVGEYFGVPFRTDYLLKAVLRNKMWGVLDFIHSHKTAPKLFELGLDAGQEWLLADRKRRRA
jgi:hypothetical protein